MERCDDIVMLVLDTHETRRLTRQTVMDLHLGYS